MKRAPKVIIIHPDDILLIILNKSTGSAEYDLLSCVTVSSTGGLSILGVPVVDTIAQTQGQFNIIDSNGIVMGIRENLNIRFFEQDSSNVRTNKITIRAESRITLANHSASNVIKGVS